MLNSINMLNIAKRAKLDKHANLLKLDKLAKLIAKHVKLAKLCAPTQPAIGSIYFFIKTIYIYTTWIHRCEEDSHKEGIRWEQVYQN
jgi:hypothetical protein